MGMLTVHGIYKDGKIELIERPDHIVESARVLVTFLPANGSPEVKKTVEDPERETLRQRAFARMKAGIHLGGPPYPKREELYDRFDR
jgi:hypothetical protein